MIEAGDVAVSASDLQRWRHAAFETFSVLTRMPGALAVSASDAIDLIAAVFPDPIWLPAEDSTSVSGPEEGPSDQRILMRGPQHEDDAHAGR